jgi:hypothetical protein
LAFGVGSEARAIVEVPRTIPAATGRDIVATGFEGLAAGAIMTPGAATNRRVTLGKVTARVGGVTTLFWQARPTIDSAARTMPKTDLIYRVS